MDSLIDAKHQVPGEWSATLKLNGKECLSTQVVRNQRRLTAVEALRSETPKLSHGTSRFRHHIFPFGQRPAKVVFMNEPSSSRVGYGHTLAEDGLHVS